MINKYTIRIDGAPYLGESDKTESADYGGDGWHVNNHMTRNTLTIGDWHESPATIEGCINLKSHIDKILARERAGTMKFRSLVIEVINSE